jgi:2-C-methyl-D-erythritol 4-phosphate cytidylyltransferase
MPNELIAIIVAAGKSQRMGGADKQLRTIGGVPVLARTVAAFQSCEDVGGIVLVLNPDNMGAAAEMSGEYGWAKVRSMVAGGERRQDSVRAGLGAVAEMARQGIPAEWVVVHDGARPLVTPGLVSRGLEAAREVGAAIAALPAADTVKVVDATGTITATPERSNLWIAQTPQVFRTDLLTTAYEALVSNGGGDPETTDCARVVEMIGRPVKVYEGERTNIKITTALDLLIAEAILRDRGSGVRGRV